MIHARVWLMRWSMASYALHPIWKFPAQDSVAEHSVFVSGAAEQAIRQTRSAIFCIR